MRIVHEEPAVQEMAKSMADIKSTVDELLFQFKNFSTEGKAYLVTGDIPAYIENLNKMEALLDNVIRQLMDAGACVIMPTHEDGK